MNFSSSLFSSSPSKSSSSSASSPACKLAHLEGCTPPPPPPRTPPPTPPCTFSWYLMHTVKGVRKPTGTSSCLIIGIFYTPALRHWLVGTLDLNLLLAHLLIHLGWKGWKELSATACLDQTLPPCKCKQELPLTSLQISSKVFSHCSLFTGLHSFSFTVSHFSTLTVSHTLSFNLKC